MELTTVDLSSEESFCSESFIADLYCEKLVAGSADSRLKGVSDNAN